MAGGFILLTIATSITLHVVYSQLVNKWRIIYIILRNFLVFGLGGGGMLICLNVLNKQNTEIVRGQCIKKNIYNSDSPLSASYRIHLFEDTSAFIEVNQILFESFKIGDEMNIGYSTGLLGYKIIEDYYLLPQQ